MQKCMILFYFIIFLKNFKIEMSLTVFMVMKAK